MLRKMPAAATPIGLAIILVAGLRGGDSTFGAFAFVAFLILGVVTYPPPDPRRAAQAVLVLGSPLCLLALGLLLDEVRVGPAAGPVMDSLLVLAGSMLVIAEAVGQLLAYRQERRAAERRDGQMDRAYPVVPSVSWVVGGGGSGRSASGWRGKTCQPNSW